MQSKTIEVFPSKIVISDPSKGKLKTLLNNLSVWDAPTHSYTHELYYYDDEGNLVIPRGVNLVELENKYYPEHKVRFTRTKNAMKKLNAKMLYEPRNDIQKNAIAFLSGEKEFSYMIDETQKFLCLKAGFGKTFCAINYAIKKNKIPIIICDRDSFMKQWKREILKFTDINEDEIFEISGTNSIEKLFKKDKHIGKKVFIASHRTLSSYLNNDGELNRLFIKVGIGMKIIDEAHVEWKSTFLIDSQTNVSETVYLTATPYRSNPNENKVYSFIYDDVYQFGLEDKYEEKYHNVILLDWNSKPDYYHSTNMNTSRGFNLNAYSDYLKNDRFEDFMKLITSNIESVIKKNKKIALVFHKNDMVQKVYEEFIQLYPDKKIGRFCGLVKNKNERQQELDSDIILTTTSSFNKGIDVPKLEVVVCITPLSSKTVIEQTVCRIRYIDEKAMHMYIDICDRGFESCIVQRRLRKEVLKQLAKKFFKIKFN